MTPDQTEDDELLEKKAPLSPEDAQKLANFIDQISRREKYSQKNPYIDYGNNLATIGSDVSHVVFGRRGSGKTTLFQEAIDQCRQRKILPVFVDCEVYKDHSFPKLLIELLVALFTSIEEELPVYKRLPVTNTSKLREKLLAEITILSALLDSPTETDVQVRSQDARSNNAQLTLKARLFSLGTGRRKSIMRAENYSETRTTIELLQIKIPKYKALIEDALGATGNKRLFLFLDDFYQIKRTFQTDTIDYIHRLAKNSRMRYKVATIRFNTTLYKRETDSIRGVQEEIDFKAINLDYTLENFAATREYLENILREVIPKSGVTNVDPIEFFSSTALKRLVEGSGGVPRDFLTIFSRSMKLSIARGKKGIISTFEVYDATRDYLQSAKIPDLQGDVRSEDFSRLENAWRRLREIVAVERRKNVFLVDKESLGAGSEEMMYVNKLLDFRFIHLVAKDTTSSNKDHAMKRYQGYCLDLGGYASLLKGRREKFNEIDISKVDPEGRRDTIRGGHVLDISELSREPSAAVENV